MTSPFLAAEVPLKELTGDELRARVAQAQMFLIYMKPTDRWSELAGERQLHLDHLRYLYKLEEEGRLFGAGPVDFQPGQPVEGLAIIVAASRDAAEQVAANEPFNKAGARVNTVRNYTVYVARAQDRKIKARDESFDPDVSGVDLTLDELRARSARATLYLVQMEPTDKERTQEERAQVMHDHFIWLRENEMAADLMSCGPTERLDGREGGDSGLAIVAAPSIDAARTIAAAEANNKAGYRILTTRSWLLNEGLAAPIGKSLATLNA